MQADNISMSQELTSRLTERTIDELRKPQTIVNAINCVVCNECLTIEYVTKRNDIGLGASTCQACIIEINTGN